MVEMLVRLVYTNVNKGEGERGGQTLLWIEVMGKGRKAIEKDKK